MNKFGFSCIYQCKDTNFKETNKVKVNVIGCIYQCKDTNFKVSYKRIVGATSHDEVVFTNAKILILK